MTMALTSSVNVNGATEWSSLNASVWFTFIFEPNQVQDGCKMFESHFSKVNSGCRSAQWMADFLVPQLQFEFSPGSESMLAITFHPLAIPARPEPA